MVYESGLVIPFRFFILALFFYLNVFGTVHNSSLLCLLRLRCRFIFSELYAYETCLKPEKIFAKKAFDPESSIGDL